MQKQIIAVVFVLLVSLSTVATGGPGSADEPVRYVGNEWANVESHDGRLRPAVGVQSCEVMHCNRTHPELADNYGWTYNHGPNIAYWNGRVALTFNEGLSWTDPVVCPTISDNSSKHWGRRTDDGRYAMLYNPDERRVSRIPTPVRHAVQEWVSDTFDNMPAGGVVTDWNIYIANDKVLTAAGFADSVDSVERIEFRTGKYRMDEYRYGYSEGEDRPNADEPLPLVVFDIDDFVTADPYAFPVGDVNQDGFVNFLDIAMICLRFI